MCIFQHISHADLTLDPYPFGGCNCTLEAFTYNKLVITLPTNFLSGRFTLGFYQRMNEETNWPIATDKEHYIRLALKYLHDKTARSILEKDIEINKTKLFSEKQSVIDWANILLKLHHETDDSAN